MLWVENGLSASEALTQIRLLASSAAVRHLGSVLLSRPEPYSPEVHTAQVWAFCKLLDVCLSQASLRNETQVALAVSPNLIALLWTDYLKVCLLLLISCNLVSFSDAPAITTLTTLA